VRGARVIEVPLPDGGRIAAATLGDGPPLLLLRPLGGSVRSWGLFASALAARTRVLVFDPRGAGASSPAPVATTTRSMAADAVAVLDALGVDRAHVYGVSLGGMVACWLAADAPARVAKLVLASTPPRALAVKASTALLAVDVVRCLARPARAAEACLAVRVLSDGFRTAHPDRVAEIEAQARSAPASHRGLLTHLAAAAAHDARSVVPTIEADALVVAGDADRILPRDVQVRLAGRLPHGRFVAIPDVGHDVSTEAPDTVAALVLEHVGGRR
jgi:pimeloyl-ACP methyl ester carboxylesterase